MKTTIASILGLILAYALLRLFMTAEREKDRGLKWLIATIVGLLIILACIEVGE